MKVAEADYWAEREQRALELADDWRKRAMFQTAVGNGAGLIAIGGFVQNGASHDVTAQAFMLPALIFAAGLVVGSIAPFLMTQWWSSRAAASKANFHLVDATAARLRVAHLTDDRSGVDRLIDEGAHHHGKMQMATARASICIGLSGFLFCCGLVLSLAAVHNGALRAPAPSPPVRQTTTPR
jgi:hypothetical protein